MADNENNPPQPSGSWPIPGEQTDELVRAAFPLRLGLVEGKVALVTGAGRGIGEATARLFAVEGAAVVVCDIDGDAAQSVVQSIQERGGEAVAVVADLTKEDEVAAVITTAIDRYGRLDCAVNNAGVSGRFGSFIDLPLHEWQHMINVKLKDGLDWKNHAQFQQGCLALEKKLGDHGRILIRPSGTEPVLRIMVEAPVMVTAKTSAEQLSQLLN